MQSLPPGFEELVGLVLEEDPASGRKLPRNSTRIWDVFTYDALFDANRSDAEVGYLHKVLGKHGLLELGSVLKQKTKWADEARKVAQKELTKLPSGRKRRLLSTFADSQAEDANRCLLEAANYFTTMKVSASFLRERTRNYGETSSFIVEIAYPNSIHHIFNIGLTKTILWLQSFGLALDFCPPSRQVIGFVDEDLGVKMKRSLYVEDKELAEIWTDYFNCIAKIRAVAQDLRDRLHKPIATRDVGMAVWYYKSCQSLIARFRAGLKRKFTPAVLMSFLNRNKWNLGELAERLCDIDEIDNLASALREFTSSSPI